MRIKDPEDIEMGKIGTSLIASKKNWEEELIVAMGAQNKDNYINMEQFKNAMRECFVTLRTDATNRLNEWFRQNQTADMKVYTPDLLQAMGLPD